MKSLTIRFVYALLLALFVATGVISPTYAQSAPPAAYVPVRLSMQSGFSASGRHAVADDFVVVCPVDEALDPSHPCSGANAAQLQPAGFDDLVLVCPTNEVLNPDHACFNRRAQIIKATADDFVLVCPAKEVLDPNHPCGKRNSGTIQPKIPGDYVMTCPVKEVLQPGHPCAGRSR